MSPSSTGRNVRKQEILAAQVRLLYANANLGIGVTILAAAILARLQWGVVSKPIVAAWWTYMIVVSLSRYKLARRFRQAAPAPMEIGKWRVAYAAAAGLTGAGWGAAGILLYAEAQLSNQVFLVFVLGGMMLGAASVLAPRPEAFLAFLIPAGFGPAARLLLHGDQTHVAMGILAAVFTVAVLVTTRRIYCTVDSSIRLQFKNRDLVDDLQAAKEETEALNQALERRVQERTAELRAANEQLRTEIAQRERMEEELLRARKLESLGVLAGGIAHDFNNFLTIVQGNLEVARTRLKPEAPVRETLDEMAKACQRAAFLSSQLLTFAKGGAPVRRLVSVAKLVTGAVQLARAGAPVSIATDIAEDLRSAEADPAQIGQVLHNLLLNARQAMPEGGIIEVRAHNCSTEAGPRIRISIRDYGCGIPADDLPRIFDPYFTTKPGASGLGLATAYAIVAKHGGSIWVDSRPGHGTEFTVELPASEEVPARQPQAAAPMQTGTERLLVMDDEDGVRGLLKTVLQKLGYEVEDARDGAEAIALYERAKAAGRGFDAVLLDLTVSGGMGGVEAAARLKELDPAAKLIVSSGYSDAPVMSDFAKYGFDAVIPKPWTPQQLSEVFRSVLVPNPDRKTT
jgi:signal transduction histidine kinase/ActR/RegA family two-component response regulator